jgi:hypothetical protein
MSEIIFESHKIKEFVTSREIINFSWKPLHHRNAYLATECPVHSTLEKFELFTDEVRVLGIGLFYWLGGPGQSDWPTGAK